VTAHFNNIITNKFGVMEMVSHLLFLETDGFGGLILDVDILAGFSLLISCLLMLLDSVFLCCNLIPIKAKEQRYHIYDLTSLEFFLTGCSGLTLDFNLFDFGSSLFFSFFLSPSCFNFSKCSSE
jgi:hypothetical protein